MTAPKFTKTVLESYTGLSLGFTDRCLLTLMEPNREDFLDVSKPLTEKQLLDVEAQAYECGYEVAVEDSQEAVRRVLYERRTEYAPKPRIASVVDHTKDTP